VSEKQERRPTQVTVAAGAVIGGALLLFFSGFDSMNSLLTVDTRERIAGALASGTAHDLGLTVEQVIGWVRVATLVSGGAAAAAAVLGWFALQRHRGARIALAGIAVVLVVCAPFAGGVLAAFVAVAVSMLWSGQARDWFAGRPVRQREPLASAPDGPQTPQHQPTPAPESAAPSIPPPTRGFGDTPTSAPVFGRPERAPQQPSYPDPRLPAGPQQPVPYAASQHVPAPSVQRPGGVVAACVLTWVFAGASALVFLLVAALLAVEPDRLVARIEGMSAWQDSGLSASIIVPLMWAAVTFYVGWSLAACLLAVFAWRRHSWARILLVISAAGAVVLCLFAFPVSIVHIIACGATIALLLSSSSNRWYAGRPAQGPVRGPDQGPPPRAW